MAGPRAFSWTITAIGSGIINVLINAPIGWFMVPAGHVLGVWTLPGVAADVVITAYGIGFGTSLVVTPQTRKQVANAKMIPPELSERWRNHFAGWPRAALRRAVNLGILSVLSFAPFALLALYLLDVQPVDRMNATLIKGTFSFIAGAIITPIIAAAATVPANS